MKFSEKIEVNNYDVDMRGVMRPTALMAKLEEFWATIKRFMIVIAIIVVLILVITVVGNFTGIMSNVSNIFKNNRKNE